MTDKKRKAKTIKELLKEFEEEHLEKEKKLIEEEKIQSMHYIQQHRHHDSDYLRIKMANFRSVFLGRLCDIHLRERWHVNDTLTPKFTGIITYIDNEHLIMINDDKISSLIAMRDVLFIRKVYIPDQRASCEDDTGIPEPPV